MSDYRRGTGRTSKMIAEALEAKRHLRPIKIVVHQHSMIDYCLHLAAAQGRLTRKDFVTPGQLDRALRGSYTDNVFVDHAFYELADRKAREDLNTFFERGRPSQ